MDDFIKNVLTTINTSVPNSIWTGDEIDDVSNDLVTRPLDNLGRIFQNALLNPVNRTLRPKITKYYTLINQKTKESLISSIKVSINFLLFFLSLILLSKILILF